MQKLLLISVTDQSASIVIKNPWKYQTRGWNRLNQEKVVGVPAGKPPARSRQHRTAQSVWVRLGRKARELLTVWTGLFAAEPSQEFQMDVSNETITSPVFIQVVLEEGFFLMRKRLKIILALGIHADFGHTFYFPHVHWWLSDTGCYDGLCRDKQRSLSTPWRDRPVPTSCSELCFLSSLWPLPPGTQFSSRKKFF